MRIFFLFFIAFFIYGACYAEETPNSSQNKTQLVVKNINQAEDLNLLTQMMLTNKKYIFSYIPLKYSKDSYIFQININSSFNEFFKFLTTPQAGFSLVQPLIIENSVEVYFARNEIRSLNYPDFFEDSILKEGVPFFFDDSTNYQLWKPNVVEVESNNSFLTSNPIQKNMKAFGILKTRQDRDFYILDVDLLEEVFIQINILSKRNFLGINIYDEKFSRLQQILLTEILPFHQIKISNHLKNKILFLEIFSNSKKGIFAGSKNFNVSYIFSYFYE